jgi:hypothetical protein
VARSACLGDHSNQLRILDLQLLTVRAGDAIDTMPHFCTTIAVLRV